MKNRLLVIYVSFGTSFFVTIIISFLLLQNIISIKKSNYWLEHTYEVRNQILKVQADLIQAENNQREFLVRKDKALLLPVSETQKSTLREIDSLKRLTIDNAGQQKQIKKLKEAVSLWYQILYVTGDSSDSEHFAINLEKGNNVLKQVMQQSTGMDKIEADLLKQRKEHISGLEIAAPRYLGLILTVSCLFQLVSFFVIIEAFKKRKIHQKILERKIKELNATNAELEQIAFVASHDLQEPLRKIRTFTDKLLVQYKSALDQEAKIIVEKISVFSKTMQELLGDLINYTQVTRNDEKPVNVDLKVCFAEVCKEMGDEIKKSGAVIRVDALPTVEGYYKQLHLLFYNLLHNALKFSRQNVAPVIDVAPSEITGDEVNSSQMFIKIAFRDNGIGFEEEYSKKIFVIFKRLHPNNSPLAGKGIGLAICNKVMLNHNGYITAKGQPGAGATFDLYFPVATAR